MKKSKITVETLRETFKEQFKESAEFIFIDYPKKNGYPIIKRISCWRLMDLGENYTFNPEDQYLSNYPVFRRLKD